MYRRSFFSLISVGLDFGLCSYTRRSRLSFIIALAAPCPCRRPCPHPPPIALSPARVRAHVRTPSTFLQLPIVIHHHPTHKSNNTTVFFPVPPARYSLVLFVLPFDEQAWKTNKCLIFMLYMIKVASTFNLWGFSFCPFVFFLPLVFRTTDSRQGIVYGKDKAKAKQSEGLCE
jgi:hypothetical protein